MVLTGPMAAIAVPPAKVCPEKRHDNPITLVLVVIGAKPVKTVVHCHVPRVAHTARYNFKIGAERIATKNATLPAPIIVPVMVGLLVCLLGKCLRGIRVRCAGRMDDVPQFPKRTRGEVAIFFGLVMAFRVSLRHVEFSIRSPIEPMQRMFSIAKIGVNHHVFIGLVVAI